ncbi:MbtH family protein [Streptomyces sp. CC208A]|uniref:MbtH family protein n=1 Tax=Streptomyces sp. CC208A TaxID=3044573 RepID=UPI0024A8419B|nr:MbtH family protein [Streptomyces sp. CC208A]
MTNPFDDTDATFKVLVNDEGQHSLWPSFAAVPEGWHIALADAERGTCLAYVEEHWTDMRPKSLADRMATP